MLLVVCSYQSSLLYGELVTPIVWWTQHLQGVGASCNSWWWDWQCGYIDMHHHSLVLVYGHMVLPCPDW